MTDKNICPFAASDDRRAPTVRLTEDTVEFLEHRIAVAVGKAWDDMLDNQTVLDLFSKRLYSSVINSVADEASKAIKSSIFGIFRFSLMMLIWISVGYVLFGVAGLTATFKAGFGTFIK